MDDQKNNQGSNNEEGKRKLFRLFQEQTNADLHYIIIKNTFEKKNKIIMMVIGWSVGVNRSKIQIEIQKNSKVFCCSCTCLCLFSSFSFLHFFVPIQFKVHLEISFHVSTTSMYTFFSYWNN